MDPEIGFVMTMLMNLGIFVFGAAVTIAFWANDERPPAAYPFMAGMSGASMVWVLGVWGT